MTILDLAPLAVTAPDTREMLTELARSHNRGDHQYSHLPTLAETIRVAAPALKQLPDDEVLAAFKDPCKEVGDVDGLEDGSLDWSDVLPEATGSDLHGQAVKAAQDRLDDTLKLLTTPTGDAS